MIAGARECVQLNENLRPHSRGGILMDSSIGTRTSAVNNFIKQNENKKK